MEFIDTLIKLRDEYKTGRFQEESRPLGNLHDRIDCTGEVNDGCGVVDSSILNNPALQPYSREELERKFCPGCGEYNRNYPEPCSFCMAEFEADEAQIIAANRAREPRCVECGVVSATFVCPSCYGK